MGRDRPGGALDQGGAPPRKGPIFTRSKTTRGRHHSPLLIDGYHRSVAVREEGERRVARPRAAGARRGIFDRHRTHSGRQDSDVFIHSILRSVSVRKRDEADDRRLIIGGSQTTRRRGHSPVSINQYHRSVAVRKEERDPRRPGGKTDENPAHILSPRTDRGRRHSGLCMQGMHPHGIPITRYHTRKPSLHRSTPRRGGGE